MRCRVGCQDAPKTAHLCIPKALRASAIRSKGGLWVDLDEMKLMNPITDEPLFAKIAAILLVIVVSWVTFHCFRARSFAAPWTFENPYSIPLYFFGTCRTLRGKGKEIVAKCGTVRVDRVIEFQKPL